MYFFSNLFPPKFFVGRENVSSAHVWLSFKFTLFKKTSMSVNISLGVIFILEC